MKNGTFISLLGIVLFYSCSSTYELTNSNSSPQLANTQVNDIMVMILYPDDMIEVRVALEKSLADEFNKNGIKAYCAYTSISSYEDLEDRTDEIKSAMEKNNTRNLLMIDPVRALDHDESKYYNEVAVYRALGMESTEFWSTVTELAESADASRFIMGVILWNMDVGDFLWQGTYNIKAPGGYDLQNAKIYAADFAKVILKTIEGEKASLQKNQ